MNPTQTIYFVQSLINQDWGNTPFVRPFATLDLALAEYNNVVDMGNYGNTVNYVQILTVASTVIQATDGAPSGPVTMP